MWLGGDEIFITNKHLCMHVVANRTVFFIQSCKLSKFLMIIALSWNRLRFKTAVSSAEVHLCYAHKFYGTSITLLLVVW